MVSQPSSTPGIGGLQPNSSSGQFQLPNSPVQLQQESRESSASSYNTLSHKTEQNNGTQNSLLQKNGAQNSFSQNTVSQNSFSNSSQNSHSQNNGHGHVTNGSNGTNGSVNKSAILEALNSTSSVLENSFNDSGGGGGRGGGGEGGGGGEEGVRGERGEDERKTWLQRQQMKLQERREGQKRTQQESHFLIKELKSSLERARGGTETTDGRRQTGGTETTDGYASDVNSLLCSETSREASPGKQQTYQVPLQVGGLVILMTYERRSD